VLVRKAGVQVTSHAVSTRLGGRVSEVRGGWRRRLRRLQTLAHATIAIVKALRRSAIDGCRRGSFHLRGDGSL
jgi:hypothetical protein